MPVRGIIILTYFAGSLPVCLFRPFYGILLWTIIAFLNPQSGLLYWGPAKEFPWAVAVAVPTLLGFFMQTRGWMARLQSREILLLFTLWIWFTITSLVSTRTPEFLHHADDTWFRWGMVSKILLMVLVTVAIVDSFRRLRILVRVICGCFGYFVLKAVPFMISTHGAYRLYGPPYSMVGDNNDLGLALCMTLPLHFAMAQTEENPWVKRLFMVMFFVTVPAIFLTYSRGALLGMVVVMTIMFLQSKQRAVLVPVIVCGVLIAAAFAPQSWKDRMDPGDAVDASARSRFNAWTYSWRLANDYPVFGGGFDTFTQELFDRYAPNPRDLHGPHSVYFGVLAEHGFPGLALYLTLVASCFLTSRRLVKRAREYQDATALRYAQMFRFSLVGFLVSGAFLGRAYFDYYFTIVGCLVILDRVCREAWRQAEEDEVYREATA